VSLYRIETDRECRARLDQLLETNRRAKQELNKESVGRINAALSEYYKLGNTTKGQGKMSPIERSHFWPAIQEAHAYRPNVARPASWREGLEEIEWKLEKYRPK